MDVRHPLGVVTPTLDGDVLTRLALADGAFTPGELRRLLPDASVEGIRKVLNRLTSHGIVTQARTGTAVTYRLNRDHLAADAIVQLAQQPATLRERLEHMLAAWSYPPVYAAVFGSWARGEATTTSDLDLFLVRPHDIADEVWDTQIDELENMASRWTGNDARTLVADERAMPSADDDPVLASVLREGLTVHGSPAWFRSAVADRILHTT